MKLKLKLLKEKDIESTVALLYEVIDEVHGSSPELERMQFKSFYSVAEVTKVYKDNDSVYLVGKIEDKVVCFLFGCVSDGIGNIQWLGVKEVHRKNGYGSMLVERAIKEFELRNCHEAKVYTIQRVGLKIFEKCGFKNITYINKNFFGVNLIQMVREIKIAEKELQTRKIIISGEAGQGIKLIAHSLASILNKLGKEVSLNLTYDSRVMGGNITAELIYSNEKIKSPFFKVADIAIQLSGKYNSAILAKKMVVEESASGIDFNNINNICMESDIIPFKSIAIEHFKSPIFVNMIVLGNLLKLIGIEIGQVNFAAEFPARFLNKNVKAVKYGYTNRDWI